MIRSLLTVLALLFASNLIGLAGAQEAAPEGQLYFTNTLVSDGFIAGTSAGGAKVFASTPDQPTGDASKKAYTNVAIYGLGYATEFRWKATEEFQLSGQATISTWISCDVAAVSRADPSGAAVSTIGVALRKNGADITGTTAALYDATPSVCTGPSSIRALTVKVNTADAKFKAGEDLGVRISLWYGASPQESQAKNLHFLVGSTKHPSSVKAAGLPLPAGAEPEQPLVQTPTHHNATLEGTTASVDASFENATNEHHTYNWTTNGTEFVISARAQVTNGSVDIEFFDGAGARVHNTTLTSANNTSEDDFQPPVLVQAASGNWTIRLAFTEFVGQVNVTVGVAPEPSGTAAATNETAAPQTTSGGGIPALPFLGGVLAVAFVVARRRCLG